MDVLICNHCQLEAPGQPHLKLTMVTLLGLCAWRVDRTPREGLGLSQSCWHRQAMNGPLTGVLLPRASRDVAPYDRLNGENVQPPYLHAPVLQLRV